MEFRALPNCPQIFVCVIWTQLDKLCLGGAELVSMDSAQTERRGRVVDMNWPSLKFITLKNAEVQEWYFLIGKCFFEREQRDIDVPEQRCTIVYCTGATLGSFY